MVVRDALQQAVAQRIALPSLRLRTVVRLFVQVVLVLFELEIAFGKRLVVRRAGRAFGGRPIDGGRVLADLTVQLGEAAVDELAGFSVRRAAVVADRV